MAPTASPDSDPSRLRDLGDVLSSALELDGARVVVVDTDTNTVPGWSDPEARLVLAGRPGLLWRLRERAGEPAARIEQLLLDAAPALPGAVECLARAYAAPVGEVLLPPNANWIAVSSRAGQTMICGPANADIELVDLGGDRVLPGTWGLLPGPQGAPRSGLAVRVRPDTDGRTRLEAGVTTMRAAVPGVDGRALLVAELHWVLASLPIFEYQLRQDDGGARLTLSPRPDIDADEVFAAAHELLDPTLGAPIERAPAASDIAGGRVVEAPAVRPTNMVAALWAGAKGSPARGAAWRSAVKQLPLHGEDVGVIGDDSAYTEAARAAVRALTHPRPRSVVDGPNLSAATYVIAVGPRDFAAAGAGPVHGRVSVLEGDQDRDAVLVASPASAWHDAVTALLESGERRPGLVEVELVGLETGSWTRPMLARGRDPVHDGLRLWVDPERCVGSGHCRDVCPVDAIELVDGVARVGDACVGCQLCTEQCQQQALRPFVRSGETQSVRMLLERGVAFEDLTLRERPRRLDGLLTRLPPPRAVTASRRTVVLGLATVTMMEHAAALLVDGQLVGAIEEERLTRVRHYRWEHPERPGVTLASDPTLRLEEAWPTRSIEFLLRSAGLTMDDVDIVGINGMPARLLETFSGGDAWIAPRVLRSGSVVFVPHHMAHAASVYGLSGFDHAWILSVDGRGDFETAALWRAEGHDIEIVDAVPWRPDRSFGGVYETATRTLGFGTHGQGSTMALAAFGEPTVDLSDCLGLDDAGRPVLSEWAAERRMRAFSRAPDQALDQSHHDLAASTQHALERVVGAFLENGVGASLEGENLALCGGVALNCRMNGTLRRRFSPAAMHVPPGANDAGTAMGAAFIAHRELTGELPRLDLGHTHLGPEWSDEALARSLARARVPHRPLEDVPEQVAELLADGQVVCWFQGPMEFGPRALCGRSILGDPRRPELKDRMNRMKSRQSWRPFGPAVLAGRQGEWFEDDWDSRFMLFAVHVRPEKRDEIPVVVHEDGTTRPQVVHPELHARTHAMIAAFARRTGVPMVVNTSFNRGGEPIVCTPVEAIRSFLGLGADALVLGDQLVTR